jgi:hypothetical protein
VKSIRAALVRLWGRTGPDSRPAINIDDPALRVVVTAFDDAEAASAALGRADHWQPEQPAVLRHHLVLPARRVDSARELLEPDGWALRPGGRGGERVEAGDAAVVALRIQHLDALRCSQESSRMAGLAQRLDGRALGWDALQPEVMAG